MRRLDPRMPRPAPREQPLADERLEGIALGKASSRQRKIAVPCDIHEDRVLRDQAEGDVRRQGEPHHRLRSQTRAHPIPRRPARQSVRPFLQLKIGTSSSVISELYSGDPRASAASRRSPFLQVSDVDRLISDIPRIEAIPFIASQY